MFVHRALPPAGLYITLCLIKSFNEIWLSLFRHRPPLVAARRASLLGTSVEMPLRGWSANVCSIDKRPKEENAANAA